MTETWAGLLNATADVLVRYDHWCTEQCTCYEDSLKLRRLASLLEQITPEMVMKLRAEATFQAGSNEGADDDVAAMLAAIADRLSPLAATPTEETD